MSHCLLTVLLAGFLLGCAQDPAHRQCERHLVPINVAVPLPRSLEPESGAPVSKSDLDGSSKRK